MLVQFLHVERGTASQLREDGCCRSESFATYSTTDLSVGERRAYTVHFLTMHKLLIESFQWEPPKMEMPRRELATLVRV